MAGGEVTAVLLKEAQQEIALLRTDLFNTRRLAEERRQAVDALQSERERLARHCDEVEASLRAANAQLNHIPELQQRCALLEASLRRLQSELETSLAARRILEQELDDERRQRAAMAEQKALLEGDRARIAKQRDDLATQLRVEQKKAREAEEEQVRAEEDAAALRAEVAALQQTAAAAATSSASTTLHPPSATAMHPSSSSTLSHTSSADTAAAIAAAIAAATTPLLEQVEHERYRAATLLSSLHAAKSEIMDLTQRLADYEARHTDMLARGHQDPDLLAHQLALLRNHNQELTTQLAASADRSRELEAEAVRLRAAVTEAEAAAAAAVAAAAAASQAQASDQQQPRRYSVNGAEQQQQGGGGGGGVASRLLGLAGRITSSGSLYGGMAVSESGCGRCDTPASATGGGEGAGGGEDVARLRQQVARLKASRDKLLAEIDKQWEEIERLGSENAVLADELRTARTLATNWERQAQDGIAQVEHLKDLLEDSARWGNGAAPDEQQQQQQQPPPAPSDPRVVSAPANATAVVTTATTTTAAAGAPSVQALQVELLGEKARSTELELQLRAVAAELLRCQHSSLDLGKSFLPMMAGVEKRLAELCRKARSS